MNLKVAWINLSSVIILPQIIAKHLSPENSGRSKIWVRQR